MLGLAGFSYSFLSQPIENIAIKYTVKSLNNVGNIASKFSRFKSIKPEFIIKVGAGKFFFILKLTDWYIIQNQKLM
ncbi:MAG TPA: hypothetical protein LFV90_02640 [Rickettsia endosymbiont of Columbicola hoogstraali]|nr:hypothetical protein [Rickettsia endosymbiont of Columbicola hoogstraali]